MASPSGPLPLPIASTSGTSPDDGLRCSQVTPAFHRTTKPDTQGVRFLSHLLPCFVFAFFVCRFLYFSAWNSILLALACTIGSFLNTLLGLYSQPPPRHYKDDHVFTLNLTHGTKDTPKQDHKEADNPTIVPAPAREQAGPGPDEAIAANDDDNVDEAETTLVGGADAEPDDRRSEQEDQDESMQDVERVWDQREDPTVNDTGIAEELAAQHLCSESSTNTPHSDVSDECDTTETPEAQPSTSTASGDESSLSGKTLLGSESGLDITLPVIATERPALEPDENDPPSQESPDLPDSENMPEDLSYYNDLGLVREIRKERDTRILVDTIGRTLTLKKRDAPGMLYMRKHKKYKNVFKIGVTKKTAEMRRRTSDTCVKDWTEKEEVHTTAQIWGSDRAETLAKRYLAPWNVDLQICAHCGKEKGSSTSHEEWFCGDLEDIRQSLDYWVRFVKDSYKGERRTFTGRIPDVLLFAGNRRLESAKDSKRLREKLGESPSRRHRRTDPACQPDTGADTTPENEDGGEDDDEEGEGRGEELRQPDFGRRTGETRGAGHNRFVTPKKKAARGSLGTETGVHGEVRVTRSRAKKLGTVKPRSETEL